MGRHFTDMQESTCMSTSFYKEWRFGPIKLALIRHFLLKCLYNARRVSSYACVLGDVACFYDFLINLWKCSGGVNFIFFILSFKVILCK